MSDEHALIYDVPECFSPATDYFEDELDQHQHQHHHEERNDEEAEEEEEEEGEDYRRRLHEHTAEELKQHLMTHPERPTKGTSPVPSSRFSAMTRLQT